MSEQELLFENSNVVYVRAQSAWSIPGLLDDYRDLYSREFSHAEIARRLNTKYPGANLTRNASIAKAHRLGLGAASGRTPIVWENTPGMLDEFKRLHASGITFTLMAEQLNIKYPGLDFTQRALRAKASSLGLPRRANHTDGPRTRKKQGTGWKFPGFKHRQAPSDEAGRLEYKRQLNAGEVKPRMTKSPIPKEDNYTPPEMRLPLTELSDDHGMSLNRCYWPYGDGPFMFCARQTAGDDKYCPYHKVALTQGVKAANLLFCEAA